MNMTMIFVIVIAGAVVYFSTINKGASKIKESSTTTPEKMPYKKKDFFFSKSELSFYRVLLETSKDMEIVIYPKSRLADIVYVGKSEKRQHYFNRNQSKHIDFLLCDSKLMKPIMCIELDDRSHENAKRNLGVRHPIYRYAEV